MTEQQTNGKSEGGVEEGGGEVGGAAEIGRVGDDKESQIKPLGCRRAPESSDQSR